MEAKLINDEDIKNIFKIVVLPVYKSVYKRVYKKEDSIELSVEKLNMFTRKFKRYNQEIKSKMSEETILNSSKIGALVGLTLLETNLFENIRENTKGTMLLGIANEVLALESSISVLMYFIYEEIYIEYPSCSKDLIENYEMPLLIPRLKGKGNYYRDLVSMLYQIKNMNEKEMFFEDETNVLFIPHLWTYINLLSVLATQNKKYILTEHINKM